MRLLLTIGAVAALLTGPALSQSLVSNPLILPSATFTTGNCIQATGTNEIASTGAPCGTGGGGGTVSGPTSSTIGAIATWGDGAGTKLADSGILAANIPALGASQTWGGLNTYAVRPIFNGATPWDSANFTPSLFLTVANAAATYATITGVQSAYMPFTGGTFTGLVTFAASQTIAVAGTGPFTGTHYLTNGVLRFNTGVDTAETGSNTGSDYHIYAYNDAGVFQGAAMTVTRSNLTAAFLNRPSFAGNLAWDAGNFNPALYLTIVDAAATYTTPAEVDAALVTFLTKADAASTYLTQANAASTYLTQTNAASTYLTIVGAQQTYATITGVESAFLRITDAALTYFPLVGGTITGHTQFNQIPVINAAIPPVTDSSGDVASTSWTQAVITSRVGNGPFIPLTGVGMPYDIHFPWVGPDFPQGPMSSSFDVLRYTFVRKVVLPIGLTGAQISCINNATNTTTLTISRTGSVGAVIGSLTFTPGSSKGLPSISSGTTTTFLPGDQLIIFTNESASNPAIADPTLNGISGSIPGTISN